MSLALKMAADISIPELAALFNRAFTGYIGGTVAFDITGFLALLGRENIDLTLSRLLVRDSEVAGIGLISRQGWTSRVAGMGIVPEAQSQGMGTWFLEQLVIPRPRKHSSKSKAESVVKGIQTMSDQAFLVSVRQRYGASE